MLRFAWTGSSGEETSSGEASERSSSERTSVNPARKKPAAGEVVRCVVVAERRVDRSPASGGDRKQVGLGVAQPSGLQKPGRGTITHRVRRHEDGPRRIDLDHDPQPCRQPWRLALSPSGCDGELGGPPWPVWLGPLACRHSSSGERDDAQDRAVHRAATVACSCVRDDSP